MTTLNIDLNTRIISADTKVYLARAGRGGHLFTQVFNTRAIGPDLPDLGLSLGRGLNGDRFLEHKIKRSRALSKWLRTSPQNRGPAPRRALAAYANEPKLPGHAQVEGVVRGYFETLKEKDLIVIPNPSNFGNAILAEMLPLDGNAVKIMGVDRFEGYEFDGRQYDYFREVRMADLPRAVVELAQAPTGFAELTRGRIKRRLFELAYDDYVLDDEFSSRLITTRDEFSSFDSTVLNSFITMVAENIERLQNRPNGDLVGLEQAAFMDVDDVQVRININSPGHIAVIAKTIAPLVVTAILSALIAVNFDAAAITPQTVVAVTNSQVTDINDLCSREVGQLSESMLRFLSAEADFQRNCALLREAHSHTGVTTNLTVEVVP